MGISCSVVIPVCNGLPTFGQCLASVARAVRPNDEIIVVADGEGDGAWQLASKFGARVVKLATNGGPARARNYGAQAATSEIVFFVDADVIVPRNAIATIESAFEKEEDLAALIGSYDEFPAQTNFLSQFKNLLHHYVHQNGSAKASTFWGACGAIRRDLFFSIGGFDEFYAVPSIEDIELGYRLSAANYKIRLVKELQVTHLKRWEPYSLVKTDFCRRAVPWTRLIWKQLWLAGRVASDLNLDAAHRWSLLTSMALVAAAVAGLFNPWSLILVPVCIGIFLFLNAPVLSFFRSKRGLIFASRAAVWRFGYDLYSFAGFCYGSSLTTKAVIRKLMLLTFAKLDATALGLAVGVVSGLAVWAATSVLLLKGGHHVGPTLQLLGQYLPGFTVTWKGSLFGFLDAFLVGFFFGWSFAILRNLSLRLLLGLSRVRAAFSRLMKASIVKN
jgi:glycosyltransferase involved in cell wall biosynthesis